MEYWNIKKTFNQSSNDTIITKDKPSGVIVYISIPDNVSGSKLIGMAKTVKSLNH